VAPPFCRSDDRDPTRRGTGGRVRFGAAIGAAILAAFTIVATVLGHRFWLLHGDSAKREFTASLEHVAVVGGLLFVVLNALPEVGDG
jgi:hypothetical protein